MNVESSSASFNSDCDAKRTLPFHQHPYRSYTMYIHYYNVYFKLVDTFYRTYTNKKNLNLSFADGIHHFHSINIFMFKKK